jgi:muramoyltetrapeptide carboxypeptidase
VTNPLGIALVSPGSCMPSEDIVQQAQQHLESQYPCRVVYGEDCYQPLSAEQRANIVLDYCFDDSIDLLWAFRGGEGSADVIPYLQPHLERLVTIQHKRWLGFSDITAMLLYFSKHCQWPVVHGPCANAFVKGLLDEHTNAAMQRILHQQSGVTTIDDLVPLNDIAAASSVIHANMVAGNLSLLNVSVKDSWELVADGRIVIIEDVNEKPHVIARTLKYLKRVGVLQSPAALIFGGFTINADSSVIASPHAQETLPVLSKFSQSCEYPVFMSAQVGHGKSNIPVPFDVSAALTTGVAGECSLVF